MKDISLLTDRAAALAELQARLRACRLCQHAGHIPTANPVFAGRYDDPIYLIGQAPGAISGANTIPFSGPSGKVLTTWLVRAGFPETYFRERVFLSSLTRCFPGPNPKGNGDRPPSRAEMALCRPYLDAELAITRPRIVLLVGKMAIEAFMGRSSLTQVIGTAMERDGMVFIPFPHPSGVSRWLNEPENQKRVDHAIQLLAAYRVKLGL